jgi:hypothetical protein
MRSGRLRPVALLGLVAYFLAAAILPPGHMAASLAAGSPFHLCPGDARSVLILTALARADVPHSAGAPSSAHPPHHQHGAAPSHAMGTAVDGLPPVVVSPHGESAEAAEPRFDSNCASASPGVVAVASADDPAATPEASVLFDALPPAIPVTSARWLRPAPRSPPA